MRKFYLRKRENKKRRNKELGKCKNPYNGKEIWKLKVLMRNKQNLKKSDKKIKKRWARNSNKNHSNSRK